MNASSREEVFVCLRKQGIKAIKVVAADGSKANGEINGVRGRVVVIAVFAAALIAGVIAYFVGVVGKSEKEGQRDKGRVFEARPISRQTIAGDRVKVSRARSDAFKSSAERFLARFAEPGRKYVAPEVDWPKQSDFDFILDKPVMVSESDFTETADMKRIVAGMKKEMLEYLRGEGTVRGYILELIKRQEVEIRHREKVERRLLEMLAPPSVGASLGAGDVLDNQLKNAYEFWLKANAQLQSLGIYSIPLPEKLRNYQLTNQLED
jgi:hypothetical protein